MLRSTHTVPQIGHHKGFRVILEHLAHRNVFLNHGAREGGHDLIPRQEASAGRRVACKYAFGKAQGAAASGRTWSSMRASARACLALR